MYNIRITTNHYKFTNQIRFCYPTAKLRRIENLTKRKSE